MTPQITCDPDFVIPFFDQGGNDGNGDFQMSVRSDFKLEFSFQKRFLIYIST